MEDLAELVEANEDIAAAIAAAYEVLLDGVPNIAGFEFLIENALATNFGAAPGVEFNQENIFINVANALVQGNPTAAANFSALIAGQATLADQVEAIYNALVPLGAQTAEGLAFLTRPEALEFYARVAAERGVAGPDGAAIVAMASILNIAVNADLGGIGDSVNDLMAAIANGSAQLPATGDTFTPIETADGTQFDGDDNAGQATIALTDRTDGPGIDESQPNSGVDTAGSDFDDHYTGTDATLTSGDIIDGNGGFDDLTLNFFDVKFTLGDVGGAIVPGTGFLGLSIDLPAFEVESTELERIEVQLEGGNDIIDQIIAAIPAVPPADPSTIELIAGSQIDLSRAEGLEELGIDRTGGVVSFTSIQNNVAVDITDSTGLFHFVFDTDALGADPATFDLTIEDVYGLVLVEANGGETFGSLALHTTGSNILMFSDNFDNTAPLTSLTVDGAGTNIIVSGLLDPDLGAFVGGEYIANEFAGLTDIDLSGNTGGTFLELQSNYEDVTYEGSSAADIALFGLFEPDFSGPADGSLTDDDDIDGGAGYDGLLMSGIDWRNLTDANQITNVEFFGVLTPGDNADPFKFENGTFNVDLGLFVDQGGIDLTLEDMDGHTVFVLTPISDNIIFDDTDDAVITLGIPPEFANYVGVGFDALDELGLDALLPVLGSLPIAGFIANIDATELETLTFNVGLPSALPFPESSLTIGNIDLGDGSTLETIFGAGPGDLIIELVTPFAAGTEDDGLTFDLSDLTGGFDGQDLDNLIGAQTYILGNLGNIDAGNLGTAYDFDDDATDDDSSVIDFGAADTAQDVAIFTTADFGNVAIENFGDWIGNPTAGQQDILDFTALGVNEFTDLVYTDVGDGVVITSDLFDGQVLLVGVTAAELQNENFDFVV